MIKIIIKCVVQPSHIDAFISLGCQLASLAKREPGCIGYQIVQNLQYKNIVFLVEEWVNNEFLGAHMAKSYFGDYSSQMVALQDGSADINVCDLIC